MVFTVSDIDLNDAELWVPPEGGLLAGPQHPDYQDHKWANHLFHSGSPALFLDRKKTFDVAEIFNRHGYVDIVALPLKRPEDAHFTLPRALSDFHHDIKVAAMDQYARNPLSRMKAAFLYCEISPTHKGVGQRTQTWHVDDAKIAATRMNTAHEIDHNLPIQAYIKSNIDGTLLQNQHVHNATEEFKNEPQPQLPPEPIVRRAQDYERVMINGYCRHMGTRAEQTGLLRCFTAVLFAGTTQLSEALRQKTQSVRSSGPSALNWD